MSEVEKKQKIRISVRNLVEFLLRTGDIDNRIGKAVQQEAMLQGGRMHRKLQRRMGANYQAEVSLKLELEEAHYIISLEGRADGVITETDGITIDEIKCMYADVIHFEEAIAVHRAQAMCYAYIYAEKHGLKHIGIQLTYCNLDTEELKRFREDLSFEELTLWFENLMAMYRRWTDFQYEWRQIRQASIRELTFPFPYRKGQRHLAGDVYRTIARKKLLFIQAPTGTGKTISTVFPAVKAVGEELGDKIFYLTAKTITRTVAKEAFDLLKSRGYQGKVLSLTAKEKLCPCEEMDCNPVHCSYAKGHYDRVNDAVFSLVTERHDLTRELLLAQAERFHVCPFEMALDASLWCDVIICDYNYVFDPNVYLKRFFEDGVKGDYIFLIDEAHNLVERGREMYSAELVKEELLKLKRVVKPHSRKLYAALEKTNRILLYWKRECLSESGDSRLVRREHQEREMFPFSISINNLSACLEEYLKGRSESPERRLISEFYLKLRHFQNMRALNEGNYVIYTDFDEDGNFRIHLYCVNPANNLQKCLDRGNAAVFFSATLLPIRYYKSLLSTREDNYAVYAESVFEEKQRLLFIARDVSSLYTRRNNREFRRIASYIRVTARAKKGNYLVFFPSYQFMQSVYEQLLSLTTGEMDIIVQSSGMSEQEREHFIEAFSGNHERTLVGFCVLGGIFSEGIDLKGDQLIGVLIVGTGLPQICNEREVLKDYYEREYGMGFDYAYRFPGMNKVLQAAGRVIRTAEDCGVIGLLDDRFLRREYRELFPREWSESRICDVESLPGALEEFWLPGAGGTRLAPTEAEGRPAACRPE